MLKILIWSTLSLSAIAATIVLVLLYGGYKYDQSQPASEKVSGYVSSPVCDSKQAEKQAMQAPLHAQEDVIAQRLLNSPLPYADGQKDYDAYAGLQRQIAALEIQYQC